MTFDVAVIGGGIIGASAAYYLARRGANVCLLERDQAPSPRAASTDKLKVFRQAYPDEFYVRLAGAAWPLWQELEQTSGDQLALPAGLLLASRTADSLESRSYEALRRCQVAAEEWTTAETTRRYPQFNLAEFHSVIYEPGAHVLLSERATSTYLTLAQAAGVEIQSDAEAIGFEATSGQVEAVITDSGERIDCKTALVTAGPWTRSLLTFLTGVLTVTRQELIYLAAPDERFNPDQYPVFIDFASGYYSLAASAGAVKLANHIPTTDVGPGFNVGTVSESFIAQGREFLARTIPALKEAPVVDSRVCLYNNTPDEEFIIDQHPEWSNCWLATGFSGHGFKFAPLIGQALAELTTTGTTTLDLTRFRLNRFWEE